MTKALSAYLQAFKEWKGTVSNSGFLGVAWRDIFPVRQARSLAVNKWRPQIILNHGLQRVVALRNRFQSFFADPALTLNWDERLLLGENRLRPWRPVLVGG